MDPELRDEQRRAVRGAVIVLAVAMIATLVLLMYLVVSLSQAMPNVD